MGRTHSCPTMQSWDTLCFFVFSNKYNTGILYLCHQLLIWGSIQLNSLQTVLLLLKAFALRYFWSRRSGKKKKGWKLFSALGRIKTGSFSPAAKYTDLLTYFISHFIEPFLSLFYWFDLKEIYCWTHRCLSIIKERT